ncbi:FtsX-like permease family protein [Streptomyces kunmingensis]|uniref:FtsX-like permease family protein n=1 Tax=Streptomyces kunmingensis TaxID=68225 RepID=A0ABU6C8T9_9ACTN|nr:FtsX-like permease family protein [Streptomyces kunmingensis]MEB3960889.1 FtsX-like permease family protein [Streptomyces kunmingensis]
MLRLALKTLRFRKGGFLASLIALFVGAVVVQGCGSLLETGIRADVKAERLAGAPVVVTGSQDYPGTAVGTATDGMTERVLLDEDLVDAVAAVPGVAEAVPDVSMPVTALAGRPAEASGHSWSSASLSPYELVAGAEPAASGDVVVDSATARKTGVRPGARLKASVRGVPHVFRVSGIAESRRSARAVLLFSDEEAFRLYDRPGKIDDIGVLVAPGTDPVRLADAVGDAVAGRGARVLHGDDRGVAEFPATIAGRQNLIPVAGAFGGLATMVAIFVVGSTVGMLVQQRRREMALLRTTGVTPGQLRRMVMAETAVAAVLAAGLSLVPGLAFGHFLYDVLVDQDLVPGEMVFRQGFVPRLAGFGATLFAALAAAFIASRRVSKVRPTEAMAEASLQTRWVSPVRLILAFLFLGGATALAIVTGTVMTGPVAASTSAPAAMLWAVGIALVAPALCRWLAALLRWPVGWFTGLSGQLAMLNASVRRVRLAAAVIPIMLATGLATALIYLQTSQDDAASRMFAEGLKADAIVSTRGAALPPSLVDTLARLPQVAGASASVSGDARLETLLDSGGGDGGSKTGPRVRPARIDLQGVTAAGARQTIARTAVQGDYGKLTGDSIVLPTDVLRDSGRKVGDRVRLRWGNGDVSSMTVVGSFTPPRGFGYAMVPAAELLPRTTSGTLSQILVKAKPGVSARELTAALRERADGVPGAVVANRSEAKAAHAQGDETGRVASFLLAAVVVGYAVIALVNSLIVATAERRGEFALQRLIGSTRRQVLWMMSVEALVTAVIGIVLGTGVAAGSLLPFGLALDGTLLPSGPGWIYVTIVAAAVALTFVTILLPTILALRAKPVEAAVAP